MTIELSAVDLHNLDCDIEKFKKGDLVRVVSKPHNLDRYFQVSKLSLSLDNLAESKLTLGQTFTSLTQNQQKENKTIKESLIINADKISKNEKDVATLQEDVVTINETIVEMDVKFSGIYRVKRKCCKLQCLGSTSK